jgi:hypothetical protein
VETLAAMPVAVRVEMPAGALAAMPVVAMPVAVRVEVPAGALAAMPAEAGVEMPVAATARYFECLRIATRRNSIRSQGPDVWHVSGKHSPCGADSCPSWSLGRPGHATKGPGDTA